MTAATILIVEDESLVAMDLRLRLEAHGYRVCGIASTGEEALALVRTHKPDIVLMDIALGPGMNGVATHQALKAILDIPVVYLTAFSDPQTLESAKAAGPYGYLTKPFDEPTLTTTLEIALARHAAGVILAREELKFRALLENAFDFITVVDAQSIIRYQSPNTARLLARPPGTMLGENILTEIHPDDHPAVLKAMLQLLEDPSSEARADFRIQHPDGSYLIFEASARNALAVPGVEGIVINSREVTAKRATEARTAELEAHLQRAQRLESLEVLAGGLAHDFNNLLLGILGNLSLAMDRLSADSPVQPRLRAAEQAGLRAAELVNQMLAFAGKGRFAIQALDLAALVQEMAPALGSLMPTGLRLEMDVRPGLPAVSVDPAQMKQCLQALILNGAEAIGGQSGHVRLRGGSLAAAEPLGLCMGTLPEGPCVFLEVSDSGCGISETQLPRIFEPFFSTKFSGRGLGLAAALGIARGHRGCIQVRSIEGEGSTFRIVLPASGAPLHPPPAPAQQAAPQSAGSPRRILVVDDEELVRMVAGDYLERIGFAVELAADGESALDLLRRAPATYGLVLLDLTMPTMGGLEVLRNMKEEGLDVPVLLTSGFSLRDLPPDLARSGASFIQKPYPMAGLEAQVRELFRG